MQTAELRWIATKPVAYYQGFKLRLDFKKYTNTNYKLLQTTTQTADWFNISLTTLQQIIGLINHWQLAH